MKKIGIVSVKQKGSHMRLHCNDGSVTTVPVHAKREIQKGLLRKIIREDLQISLEEFLDLYTKFK